MMQLLGQSGGSGGWFSPLLIKYGIVLIAVVFSLLGNLIKKINEKNAKRAAEMTRQRRQDDILRTGRDESGAFVDVARRARTPQGTSQGLSVGSPPPAQTPLTADDARRKLQELADRRRRELAEMVRRSQPAGGEGPGGQAPARNVPPVVAGAPAPAMMRPARQQGRPSAAGSPMIRPPATEREVRRKRDDQANSKAAQQAAARRKAQELERLRPQQDVFEEMPHTPTLAAYRIAEAGAETPDTAAQQSAAAKVGAVLARFAGASSAAEWRRAIVMSELLRDPVVLRAPEERMM